MATTSTPGPVVDDSFVGSVETPARPGHWLARKSLFAWARMKVLPEDPVAANGIDLSKPIFYVVETRIMSSLLVLEELCVRYGLPRPHGRSPIADIAGDESWCAIHRRESRFRRKPAREPDPALAELVAAARKDPDLDVQIVPVGIFWGRAPDREQRGLSALFADSWGFANPLQRFFTILFHGRQLLVQVSKPLTLRQLVDEGLDEKATTRKLSRILRVHLRRLRVATIGPDLSHRRMLVDQVLQTRYVRAAIEAAAQRRKIEVQEAERIARRYANEIAAEYSQPVIRFSERVLAWLWNRLYDGIELYNVENLKENTSGNELVYTPCHRSHIDYMLLSCILYSQGLMPPHIAAGINLNLPIVGRFLRRGGAFFLRRSFQGNRLYAAVFQQYLASNLVRGVPIEYFIEGGRSRTGRLLKAKGGMLAMTVRSFLHDSRRPIVFLPVYIGFERLVEGGSYISELSGEEKKKETVRDLVKAPKYLKGDFGNVHVSFGEPVKLAEKLDATVPGWRDETYTLGDRPEWLDGLVQDLGDEILVCINDAAVVTPVNLIATALLSMPRQAMTEQQLLRQLELYVQLMDLAPYSPLVSIPMRDAEEIVSYTERMKILVRDKHKHGDIMFLEPGNAVLLTYFRNNIAHVFALPALIAACFVNNRNLDYDTVIRLCRFVYPYIRSELFLRWEDEGLEGAVNRNLDAFAELGLLEKEPDGQFRRPDPGSPQSARLLTLAQGMQQTLQRFYLTMAVLLIRGPNTVSHNRLENECQTYARRLSALYEFNAPDFFDKRLFRNFLNALKEHEVISTDEKGTIVFDESVGEKNVDANLLLREAVRHRILQVIQE